MSTNSLSGKKELISKLEKTFIPDNSAALARTHKIIRIEREKEIQFMKLCRQIRLNDLSRIRSDNQREQRRLKRKKKYYPKTSD
jgi:hypothetical protein